MNISDAVDESAYEDQFYDSAVDKTGGEEDTDYQEGIEQLAPLRDQDRFLPIANVSKIMKRSVPGNGKIAKEAKETMQECVSEFISFITSEAAERCQQERRKTINGEDLLCAMTSLGFDNYLDPLKTFLCKYREANKVDMLDGVLEDLFSSTPTSQMPCLNGDEASSSSGTLMTVAPSNNSSVISTDPTLIQTQQQLGVSNVVQYVPFTSAGTNNNYQQFAYVNGNQAEQQICETNGL